MEGFKITKGQSNISLTLGIPTEKADEMRAVILVSFYLHNKHVTNGGGYMKPDTYEVVAQKLIDSVDQSNVGELLYAGTKLYEFTEDLYKGLATSMLETVAEHSKSSDEANMVKEIAAILEHK